MQAKKAAEAAEHMRLGDKALKTSLTKWSPDHDSAGDEYSKAATCYKVAKAYQEALQALDKACECYKQCKSLYHAAKTLEQSVLIVKEIGQLDQVEAFAERGALLYRQHGSPESASQLLEKAGKILEPKYPEKALGLYKKAAETVMVEDRPKEAGEYMQRVAKLQVKLKMWSEAASSMEEGIKLLQESGSIATVGRLITALVMVEVVREDIVQAEKQFQTWGGYCEPDQSAAINSLINGLNDEDADEVKKAVSSQAFKNLDVEYTRMIREIKVPEEGSGMEAAAKAYGQERAKHIEQTKSASSASHSYGVDPVSPSAIGETREQREEDVRAQQKQLEEEDDDDDDEGLC